MRRTHRLGKRRTRLISIHYHEPYILKPKSFTRTYCCFQDATGAPIRAGGERFAADARAIAATMRAYTRKPEALLKPMAEAAALLTADRSVAVDLVVAAKHASDGGGGAAVLAKLRDAVRVHRLSDAQVAKVIARRVDMS